MFKINRKEKGKEKLEYRTQIFGINVWHDIEPIKGSYPFDSKNRATHYAHYLAYLKYENKTAARVIDNSGYVWIVYNYFLVR
jgi:hypothetical protein